MSRTILIVEDNSIERAVLQKFLGSTYDVIAVAGVREMLEVLKKQASTLSAILMDLVMPEMDGYTALRMLRENDLYRQIPVIVTTALTDEESQVRALSLGANGYVFKPFNKALLTYTLENAISLREKSALLNTFRKDSLTGLLNRTAFFDQAESMIRSQDAGYYILSCCDVENFKIVNDQYGAEAGDRLLKRIASLMADCVARLGGICCRYTADKFGMLYPAQSENSDELLEFREKVSVSGINGRAVKVRVGRYLVDDLTVPVSAMYDRATLAEESIRGRYDISAAKYTDSMRAHLLNEQRLVNDMDGALANGEFVPWFQPQYNHATGALIGAEALVRWLRDGSFLPPATFIPVFERNGFIYQMDLYIWEQVCVFLRRWLDKGSDPLPVSVNVSRCDLFHADFLDDLTGLLKKYRISYHLLRLEVTESAFAESSGQIVAKVDQLISMGFVVEIDDFGSGYSSLNTLKDVPASILKLDMKFFENTHNQQRGGNIVESVVRMSRWLGMAVIAEGVESKEQADYLRSIGCYYIQGYFYARPMPLEEYETLMASHPGEQKLTRLHTVENLNNNEFWNPKSMETLIFNSYVGGACIFEYHNGETELLRVNEQYARELGQLMPQSRLLTELSLVRYLDKDNQKILEENLQKAIDSEREAACDLTMEDDFNGAHRVEYIRVTVRLIARTEERYLFYCVLVNTTNQHRAEQDALIASERITAIMNSSQCGITAVIVRSNGAVEPLFVNNRYYDMLGYTQEQFRREVSNPFDRIAPGDYNRVVQSVTAFPDNGDPLTLRMRAFRRDGRLIWLRTDISMVRFADKSEPVQLSNFLDITDQVEAEKKQQESARQLEAIMNNVNGGVSALTVMEDGTSRCLFHNRRYYELYGYTQEQAEAEKLDVLTTILPADFSGVMEKIRQLKANRQPVIIDFRILKRDGSLAYLRSNSSLMYMDGYGDALISVVIDITEKVSMEQQLHAIFDNINGGVTATVVRNGKPEILIANDCFFQILGYDTREEYDREYPNKYDSIYPEDRERVIRQFESSDGGKRRYTIEYRIIRRDGELRYIRNCISEIHLFGVDEPVRLSVENDITDLRLSQQKELEANDKLSAVLNHVGNGIVAVILTPGTREFLFVNDKYFEIVGYTREAYRQATEQDYLALIHPEDREKIRQKMNKTNRTEGTVTVEYRLIRGDGAVIWLRMVVTVTRLEGIANPVQIGVASDITAERQAGEQLRLLNDSAHDILAQPDSNLAVNRMLENLMAYFEGDCAYVVEHNNGAETFDNTYVRCAEGFAGGTECLKKISFSMPQPWLETLRKNECVVVANTDALGENWTKIRELLCSRKVRSLIMAPLWRDGVLVGAVGIDNPRKSAEQLDRLNAVGDHIAILLTRRDLSAKIDSDRKMMESLMSGIPGGFVRIRLDKPHKFIPTFFNDAFGKLVGMTQEQLHQQYGRSILNGIHPKDRKLVKAAGKKMLEDGEAESARFRVRNGRGEYIWLVMYGRAVQDSGVTYLNVYYSDATRQVREEMLQKEAAEQQKELLDNLPCGAALYEYDGKSLSVIHINKSYWKLVGRTPADYSVVSVFDMIHPCDQNVVQQEIQAALSQHRNIAVDIRIRCETSSYKPFHIVAAITPEENGKYLFFTSYTPISESTMSVQEMLPVALATMMSTSEDFSYVKDLDFRYICCSQSVADMLGLASPREIIGKDDYGLFDKKFADNLCKRDKRVIENRETVIGLNERVIGAGGKTYLVNTSIYPIQDSLGNVIGLYGVSRDVTAQREKESRLELLADSIPGGLATYEISKQGLRMRYFNDGFFSVFGCSREEYQKNVERDPLSYVFEEDRPDLERMIQNFIAHQEEGYVRSCVFRGHTKEGGYRWMNMRAILSRVEEDQLIVNVVKLDITEQQEEKERLQVSEELNRLAIEQSGNIITRLDVKKRTLTLPDTLNPIFMLPHVLNNVPEEQISLGRVSLDTADAYNEMFSEIQKGQPSGTATFKHNSTVGWRWLEAQFTASFSNQGKPVFAVISFSDVTEKLEKEVVYNKWQQSLDERPVESYTLLRCNLSKGTAFDSREGKLLHVNSDFSGQTFKQCTVAYAEQCVCPEDRERYLQFTNCDLLLSRYRHGLRSNVLEYRELVGRDETRWLRLTVDLVEYPSSKDVEAYLMYEDIDHQKRMALQTLERAQTDPLTGILNRSAFIFRMEQTLRDSVPGERHALLMLDVDNFKTVNDTLGHGVGDQVLLNLTTQIRSMLRKDDLVGRLGGDEFFIFLRNIPDAATAAQKAKRICNLNVRVGQKDAGITVSVGIAMVPKDGNSFDELYQKVDAALYQKKQGGKAGYLFVEE